MASRMIRNGDVLIYINTLTRYLVSLSW